MRYNYNENKEIRLEWDETKRQQILAKHKIDILDAIEVMSDPNVSIYPDNRRDYNEPRFNAYGISKGRRLRVCFTPRGGSIRIITMFNVHEKEWRKYYGAD